MLTTDELGIAIKHAQRAAGVCTRFCAVGGTCGESGYRIHHNGLGSSDTSEQQMFEGWILELPEDLLILWLAAWLRATHKGRRFDLNMRRRDQHVF
jgi:hypothetical protein